jgi:hypothetical protein
VVELEKFRSQGLSDMAMMPQSEITAALARSLGADHAAIIVQALAQEKRSERRFSRVLLACHETGSILHALKKEFGGDLLGALCLALDGEDPVYARQRGISAYLRIHDGGSSGSEATVLADLRDEFTVNVERLLACRHPHQEAVRQQFKAAFRIWESRYLALMGPFPEDVDALDAIHHQLRGARILPDNMGASLLESMVDWLGRLLLIIVIILLLYGLTVWSGFEPITDTILSR